MASKKSRRPPANDLTEERLLTELEKVPEGTRITGTGNEVPLPEPKQLSLAEIRAAVLRAHTHTAHTIADLEAWRDEIEATLAFLRARGR